MRAGEFSDILAFLKIFLANQAEHIFFSGLFGFVEFLLLDDLIDYAAVDAVLFLELAKFYF